MTGMDLGASPRWGVAAEHFSGLEAMLFAPIVVWMALRATHLAAGMGSERARRWLARYDEAPLARRAAAWLLVATSLIHLALVPAHRQQEPGTALLFEMDAMLFLLASVKLVSVSRWRGMSALLLVANITVYLGYLLSGREEVDQLGIATKLIELTALGLILIPSRSNTPARRSRWWWSTAMSALLAATVLTGAVIWSVSAKADGGQMNDVSTMNQAGGLTGMVMQPVSMSPPSMIETAAADQLAAATKKGIAKYEDVNVARADGYRASTPADAPTVHYANPAYQHDGQILDPTRPEALVYANTRHGLILLGAMYEMPTPGATGPDIGGRLTQWHVHTSICLSPLRPLIVGVVSPFGACPSGSINLVTPAMLHVWTVDLPGGPFSELSPADVVKIAGH